MQVLGKGQQLEIGGSYGVLTVQAGRNRELMVRAWPAHETKRLIRQGEIIVNEFLELAGLVRST